MKQHTLLVLVLLMAGAFALAKENQHVKPSQPSETPKATQQATPVAAPPPDIQKPIDTDWSKPKCKEPQSHDEADLCEQIRVANDADDSVFLSKVQLGISVVGILFVLYSLYYTRVAARAAEASADVAEKSIVASRKAFIYAESVKPYFVIENNGDIHWNFRPIWRNSGESQTKNFRMYVDSVFINSLLPNGYDFSLERSSPATGMIPPQSSWQGGQVPAMGSLSPDNVRDIIAGKMHFYMWGWVKYNDIFPGTPEHITRFCWRLVPVGDPFDPIEAKKIRWDYQNHAEGNCADNECRY